jgi:hypothetical protein
MNRQYTRLYSPVPAHPTEGPEVCPVHTRAAVRGCIWCAAEEMGDEERIVVGFPPLGIVEVTDEMILSAEDAS